MVLVSKNLRVAAKLLACAAIAACSSGDDGGGDEGGGDTGKLQQGLIQFSSLYSAFDDNAHTYYITPSVPLAADNPGAGLDPVVASSLKWSVADAKIAKDEGQFEGLPGGRMFSTKASGTTIIKVSGVTKGGTQVRGEATLKVTKATADEWAKGEARYSNGMAIDMSSIMAMMAGADGGLCGLPVSVTGTLPKNSACTNCHNSNSGNQMFSVEHTPTQTAGYSDDDLIQIFTKAQKPMGGTFNSPILKPLANMSPQTADCVYKSFHTWEIDADTQRGVVYKLRSIPPKVQAALDTDRIRAQIMAMMGGGARAGSPATP